MVLTVEKHEGGVALVTLSENASKNTFNSNNIDTLINSLENLMEASYILWVIFSFMIAYIIVICIITIGWIKIPQTSTKKNSTKENYMFLDRTSPRFQIVDASMWDR